MTELQYIWIVRWDEFQTYHLKRGKRWVPPWIRTYPRQLDDDRYYSLTDAQKLTLHELRLVFASASLQVPLDTRWLTRRLGRRITRGTLEALNEAGLIVICSRTVLERFQDAFWNGSNPEVEVEVDIETTPVPVPEVPLRSGESADIEFEGNGAGAGAALYTQSEVPQSNLQAQLRKQIDARREAGDLNTPIEFDETHYTIPPMIPEPLPEQITAHPGDTT